MTETLVTKKLSNTYLDNISSSIRIGIIIIDRIGSVVHSTLYNFFDKSMVLFKEDLGTFSPVFKEERGSEPQFLIDTVFSSWERLLNCHF